MFSREKAPVVSLPSPPNVREMLEDIETCQKTDPVFDLSQCLSIKSKQSLIKSSSSRQDNLCSQIDSNEPTPVIDSEQYASSASKSSGHKKSSKKKNAKGGTKPFSSSHNEATYTNIIQFTTVCDQTTELISDIEPMLKKLDIDISEFLTSLDMNGDDEQHKLKNDSDNDNKLL